MSDTNTKTLYVGTRTSVRALLLEALNTASAPQEVVAVVEAILGDVAVRAGCQADEIFVAVSAGGDARLVVRDRTSPGYTRLTKQLADDNVGYDNGGTWDAERDLGMGAW